MTARGVNSFVFRCITPPLSANTVILIYFFASTSREYLLWGRMCNGGGSHFFPQHALGGGGGDVHPAGVCYLLLCFLLAPSTEGPRSIWKRSFASPPPDPSVQTKKKKRHTRLSPLLTTCPERSASEKELKGQKNRQRRKKKKKRKPHP